MSDSNNSREKSDFFERFENADSAREGAEEKEEVRQEKREELVELDGKAADLFQNRVFDTFTLEAHGTEIEFYRPVDASNADLSSINDQDFADRMKHASKLINDFEEKQRETLTAAENSDKSLVKLYEDSLEGTELMRKILSAHAVDESYWDPRVWTVVFAKDDRISELFQDFFEEGGEAGANMREQLAMLQRVASGSE